MTTLQTPLVGLAVMTSGTAPSVGKVNVYNATSEAISATLPALSELNVGARLIVGKYIGDTSANTVTINCSSGDKFCDNTTTSLSMSMPGAQRELFVISISGTKRWSYAGSLHTATSTVVTVDGTQVLTNKTLTTPSITTGIKDVNGNTILGFSPNANAVNYVGAYNNSAGGTVGLFAGGTSTEIVLTLAAKGSQPIWFSNSNGTGFQFNIGAGLANSLSFSSGAAGAAPQVAVSGSDTNINLNLASKGTGVVQANGQQVLTKNMGIALDYQFTANGMKFASANDTSGYPLICGTGSGGLPANYFNFTNAIAGSPPTLSAIGIDANINLNLATKGTGTVKANGVALRQGAPNAQTGTTYTLALADAGLLVTLNNGSAITLTVPTNTTAAFPVGTTIDLAQLGAGQVTVAPADGTVTINATPGLKIAAQYGGATLTKLATNTWLLIGGLAA